MRAVRIELGAHGVLVWPNGPLAFYELRSSFSPQAQLVRPPIPAGRPPCPGPTATPPASGDKDERGRKGTGPAAPLPASRRRLRALSSERVTRYSLASLPSSPAPFRRSLVRKPYLARSRSRPRLLLMVVLPPSYGNLYGLEMISDSFSSLEAAVALPRARPHGL